MNTLGEDQLVLIFKLLDFDDRKNVLPLVCKFWRECLSKPSAVWEECGDLEFSYTDNYGAVLSWFKARAPAIQSLELLNITGCGDNLPSALLGALTALLSDSLLQLHIEFHVGNGYFASQDICVLGCLHRLQRFIFAGFDGILEPQHINQFSRLHSLLYLDLEVDILRVNLFPEQLCTLSQLTHLRFAACGSDEYADNLVQLPDTVSCLMKLQSLVLEGQYLEVTPAFSAVTSLTKLRLVKFSTANVALRCLPSSLNSLSLQLTNGGNQLLEDADSMLHLSQLVQLRVTHCGLSHLPPAVQVLSKLQHLDLSHSRLQDLPAGAYLSSLSRLSLTYSGLAALPAALMHARSLTHLDLSWNEGWQLSQQDVELILSYLPALMEINVSHCCDSSEAMRAALCLQKQAYVRRPGRWIHIIV